MPNRKLERQNPFQQHVQEALNAAAMTLAPPEPEGIHIPRVPRPVIRTDGPSNQWIERMQRDLVKATTLEKIFSIVRSTETFAKPQMEPEEAQTVQKYAQAFSDKLQDLSSGYRGIVEMHLDDAALIQHKQQRWGKHIAAADEAAQSAYNGYAKQSFRLLITGGHGTKDFIAAKDVADTFLQSDTSVSRLKDAASIHEALAALCKIRDGIRTVEGSQAKMLTRVYVDRFEKTLRDIDPGFAAICNARKK